VTDLAIEASGLRKVFGDDVIAVDGVDLAVREHEIFGFLGPNGAGKSTTARILTTLLRPTEGTASVAGLDVLHHPNDVRKIIGVALQEVGLDALATGRELILLQAYLHGFSTAESKRRADEVLEIVGLTEAADRRVGTYSGGMKRRLDLANALIHSPLVLFLDEPTTGLDPASRQAIWDEVARLNREEGIAVFLTTQYLEEADRLADRVSIIDRGRIVAMGTPQELKSSIGTDVITVSVDGERIADARAALASLDGLADVQLEADRLTLFVSSGSSAVADVIRLLDQARVDVGPVAVSHATLDDVFLKATGSRLEGASTDGEGDG